MVWRYVRVSGYWIHVLRIFHCGICYSSGFVYLIYRTCCHSLIALYSSVYSNWDSWCYHPAFVLSLAFSATSKSKLGITHSSKINHLCQQTAVFTWNSVKKTQIIESRPSLDVKLIQSAFNYLGKNGKENYDNIDVRWHT